MSDVLVRETLVTAEEFYRDYAGRDGRAELVNGRVVEMPPVATNHGDVDSQFHGFLGPYVRRHRLGKVYLNTGFILRRNPDVVRGPDEAFVSRERILANPPPARGFWEMVPDLAVEIVSPDDTARELRKKVEEYLSVGVRAVWVVYPVEREVHVHRPGADVEVLPEDGILDGGEVLPGFRLPLAEVWVEQW